MKLAGISEKATNVIREWREERGITDVKPNRFDPHGTLDISWRMGENGATRYGRIHAMQNNDGTMSVQAMVTSSGDGGERDRLMTTKVRVVPLEKLKATLDELFNAAKSYGPVNSGRTDELSREVRPS
jgi:hypothetical protein